MPKNLDDILKELKKYKFSSTNDNGSFHTSNNAKYTGNYTAKSIKRTQLTNCIFQSATFDDAAVTGSIFQGCNFSHCSMKKADFEFCNFDNCDFFNNPFEDESFNNSTFYSSKFINSPFTSCTLTGVHFKTALFSHSDIIHCTLEGAVFEDCTFKNMDLSQLNMEYIELKNVHMEKVLLPFSQIPYIFGGIKYIKNTLDDVWLTADGSYYITKEEYLNAGLKLLCEYFEVQESHFPLANIYLGLEEIAKAYKHLQLGIQQCVIMKDFRMLKYFCKLAAQSSVFTYKQLNSMYALIQKYFPQDTLSNQQLYSYSKHIGEIKTILFSKHNIPRMTFSIRTNIEPDNFQTLSNFLEKIFLFKTRICSNKHTAQLILAQNSPFVVTVDITDEFSNLCGFAMVLIKLISESNMLYEMYLDCINSYNNIANSNLVDTIIPLLEIVEEQKNYYMKENIVFSIDEILFYNINPNIKTNLQYFNISKKQGVALAGE